MLVSAQIWGQVFALAPEFTKAKGVASRILSLLDNNSVKKQSVKESQFLPGDVVARTSKVRLRDP